MQFGILGPLEVRHDGAQLHVGGARRRAVLARLLVHPGRVVTTERIIDDVWHDEPPSTARKSVQKYVSELRRTLPEPVLLTTGAGYVLDIDADMLDAWRFERLVIEREYATALGLWRGDVLADLGGLAFVDAERVRLDELRLLAWQGHLESELAAGRHEQVTAELTELLAAHPMRERVVQLQMLALYRSGRQGDALDVFHRHRQLLTEEMGVEPSAELRDLQVAILKQDPGLDIPVRVQQPLARPPVGNLPAPLSSFVGRERELSAIDRALTANRVVSLTGPGGVGKTRLALETAVRRRPQYDGGAWVVDLADLTAGAQVPAAFAMNLRADVRHAPDELTAVEARLTHTGPCLIVLDNCEHLVEACSMLVRRLARNCPDVTVLATSRHPLGVDGEYVMPVSSLSAHDAARLFVERGELTGQASHEAWDSTEVVALCASLDGLPLAIELAASQLRVMTLTELATRMSDRLTFRSAGQPGSPRQGTLRGMVSWSYDLLPDTCKRVFSRLGVFRGTLTLASAEAVCSDLEMAPAEVLAHLTTLVDHSLVLRIPHAGPDSRFRQLESLRLFALEQLAESGAETTARRAHAAYLRDLAAEAGRHIYGSDERAWQAQLEEEAGNLEAALAWAVEHEWSLAVDLAVALWPYWDAGWGERGAVAYLDRLLTVTTAPAEAEQRAWALVVAADMAANQGDARRAVPWAREAVQAFGADGSARGRTSALVALGSALGSQGALIEAGHVLAEAVAAAELIEDDVLAARALNRQHFVAARHGDQALAEVYGRQELARWRTVGSARGEATALRHLAVTAFRFGDLDKATALCQQALAMWREVDDPAAVAHVQTTLGDIARERGDTSRATALYRAALVDLQAIGDRRCEASTCKNLAVILAAEDAHEQGARLFREGIALRHELGDEAGLAECLEGLAGSLRAMARHDESATMLGAAAALRADTASMLSTAEERVVEELDAATRAELGAAGYVESWQRGNRMDVAEIVQFALGPGPPEPRS